MPSQGSHQKKTYQYQTLMSRFIMYALSFHVNIYRRSKQEQPKTQSSLLSRRLAHYSKKTTYIHMTLLVLLRRIVC